MVEGVIFIVERFCSGRVLELSILEMIGWIVDSCFIGFWYRGIDFGVGIV